MKIYWDLSEKDRVSLTSEELESLFKFELMAKGIVKPEKPEYEEEETCEVAKVKFYKVTYTEGEYGTDQDFPCLFETSEQAEEFIKLKPAVEGNERWEKQKFFNPVEKMKIKIVEMPTKQHYEELKTEIKRVEDIQDRNQSLRDKYNRVLKECDEATQSIWDDWYGLAKTQAFHQKIIDVFNDYEKTCDGDKHMAYKFLLKAYDPEQISYAFEWFGMNVPVAAAVAKDKD